MNRLVLVNKKLYAVGFSWHSIASKKQLPSTSTEYFDVITLNGKQQFGTALTDKNEQFLNASCLATAMDFPEPFFGVFKLVDAIENKEIYWLFAKDKENILGLGDFVCHSQEELQKTIETIKSFSAKGIEPIFFDTVEESVDFLSKQLKTKKFFNNSKIHPLYRSKKQSKQLKAVIAVSLVFIGLTFGLMRYLDIRSLEQLQEAALFSKQSMENKIADIRKNSQKYFPMNWKKNNYPLDVYNVCKPVLFSLPVNEFGWALEKGVCTPKEATSYWKHEKQASFINLPFNGELTKPQEVTAKHEIAEIKLVQSDVLHTQLLHQEEATKLMYQLTQNMGANLTLTFDKKDIKEFKELKFSIQAPFCKAKYEWKSVPSNLILSDSLFHALNSIPSLSVQAIEYNNGQWSVKGDLYVQ